MLTSEAAGRSVLKAEAKGWSVLKAKPGEAGRSVLKACEAAC
jgi:hypothetical protein